MFFIAIKIAWSAWVAAGSTVALAILTAFYVIYTQRLSTGAHCPFVAVKQTDEGKAEGFPIEGTNALGGFDVNLILVNAGNAVALEIKCDVQIEVGQDEYPLTSTYPLRTAVFLAPGDTTHIFLGFSAEARERLYHDTGIVYEQLQENLKRTESLELKLMHAYRMVEKPYPRMLVRIWYSNHLGKWHRVTYTVGLFRKPGEIEVITAVAGFENEHGYMERLSKRKATIEVQQVIGSQGG